MSNQAAAIDIDIFNKVVDYLSKRPYNEVSSMIDEIRENTQLVTLESNEEESSSEE